MVPLHKKNPNNNSEFRDGSFKDLVDHMKKNNFEHHYISNAMWNHTNDNYYILANGIFSKHKMSDKKCYNLCGNRCTQVITINYNNKNIDIINTHLEYDDEIIHNNKYNYEQSLISKQIEQLQTILESRNNFYILCGDFNHDISTDTKFSKLMNICEILSPRNTYKKITGINSNQVIDYILIKYDPAVRIKISDKHNSIIKSKVSDHYPVLGSIEFKMNEFDVANKKETLITGGQIPRCLHRFIIYE
jgi:endonuclease/exonuclease/phosphatase family metal-dependent hydrolase